MAKGRRPQDPDKVPFQEMLPLTLRNRVSGKGNALPDIGCIPEMQNMFACLKKHDFEQSKCPTEVNKFQKCYETFMQVRRARDLAEKSGVLIPGAKTVSSKILNNYLRKFPIPK